MIRRLVARAAMEARVAGAVRALARERPATIADAYDLVERFEYRGLSIRPWQIREEFEPLLELVARERPRTVLEIGSARGGTLFLLARAAADDALLVSVDLPGGAFGGSYHPSLARLFRSFARGAQRVELVRADSHDPATKARVEALLAGRSLDLLFVDGDHRYEGVRADFEDYAPLVRAGGLVVFHDVVEGDAELVGGVPRFWREVRDRGQATELIRDPAQGGCGIGVLRVEAR